MNIIKKFVLLLKLQDEKKDKYDTLLTLNGFTVKYLQILDFNFINLDKLSAKLNNINDYDGLIFSSPRAVQAAKLSLNGTKLHENWCDKNNFVVGETSFDLVLKELNITCKGRESGNAINLVETIIQEHSTKNFKKFLFPCGNLKQETLAKHLKAQKIGVDDVTVYETTQNPNIKNNFRTITSNLKNIPEYIVYFSPSGVKYTTYLFEELHLNLQELRLVAIGPSTEEALKNENLPVYSVAEKPNETALLKAIMK